MIEITFEHAVIINLDKKGEEIRCMFNPKEYVFSKQNQWERGKGGGGNVPSLEFSSGSPATLQVQLIFDTFEAQKDVRVYTDPLWQLMMVDPELEVPKSQKARPPQVRFQWGRTWSFDAIITSLSQKFVLFLADGRPVRALVDVNFEQVADTSKLSAQNPTSAGHQTARLWTVHAHDTLASIAYHVYGDASRWRPIAVANRLSQVRDLAVGAVLVIPNG